MVSNSYFLDFLFFLFILRYMVNSPDLDIDVLQKLKKSVSFSTLIVMGPGA